MNQPSTNISSAKAAQNINKAGRNGVELIQHYFEPTARDEEVTSVTLEKATQSIRETPQKIREVVTNQVQAQVTGKTNGTA
ncbi:MAG TPA: hypothetical protein VF177_10300 [Anaerolineae bacterium]